MPKKWTHVRVQQETAARIRAMCESLMREHTLGGRALPDIAEGRITVDSLLCWLMDAKDDHRARARKAKLAGKARKAAQDQDGPEVA